MVMMIMMIVMLMMVGGMGCSIHLDNMLGVIGGPLFAIGLHYLLLRVIRYIILSTQLFQLNEDLLLVAHMGILDFFRLLLIIMVCVIHIDNGFTLAVV